MIKDHYEATQKAYSTMDILPYDIKSPAMTAMWEMALDNIVLNENETSELFVNNIVQWLNEVFAKCTTPEAVKFIKRIAAGTKKSDAPVFNCVYSRVNSVCFSCVPTKTANRLIRSETKDLYLYMMNKRPLNVLNAVHR